MTIGFDDAYSRTFDKEEPLAIRTLSLDDMYANDFLIETIFYSGLSLFLMHELEIGENDFKIYGMRLNKHVIDAFMSTNSITATQNISQYMQNLYNQ